MEKNKGSKGRLGEVNIEPQCIEKWNGDDGKNEEKLCEASHGQAVNQCGSADRKSRCPRVAIGMMSDYQVKCIERLSNEVNPSLQ